MKRFIGFAALALLLSLTPASHAQVRPVNDYGALGIGRLLRKLDTTASVMMVGAHPDDEDSSLLAYLARGENARTAYLSLTRGDGGQNIIGPELFESLGVIRTEELLQARRLDGAEQYFARAFDYGFSKSLAEAQQKWDEKVILCDVVRGIRTFRPLVVISRFSGTPADGHGQHQYAGYITPLAVKAAGDPGQCTTAGLPWVVKKFYKGIGTQPTLRVNTGQFDPLLGRYYSEIAIEGRSLHRSQGEGRIEPRGEQFSNLTLSESVVPKNADEKSIFDGLDTTLAGASKQFIKGDAPASSETTQSLSRAQAAAERARREFTIYEPGKSLPALVEGYDALGQLFMSYLAFSGPERSRSFSKRINDESEIAAVASTGMGYFADAIRKAAGVQIDALSDVETVVPGESLNVTTRVYFPKNSRVGVKKIEIAKASGWLVTPVDEPADQASAGNVRRDAASASARFKVDVPTGATITEPYWLSAPRQGDLFAWPVSGGAQNFPFDGPVLQANVWMDIDGKEVVFSEPVQYRFADPSRGEVRREVNVVPRVSVKVTPALLVVSQSSKPQMKQVMLRVSDNSMRALSGSTELDLPEGWSRKQSFGIVEAGKKGQDSSLVYDLTVPANAKPGKYRIKSSIMFGEGSLSQTMNLISYPHIQTHRYYTPAETHVEVIDLKFAPVKIGYVMGSGDDVPEGIRQMGIEVTLLDDAALASGDLSQYDTIVVGIRASETRPAFVSNFKRLTEFMNAGGNLIMQYQRGNFAQSGLTPYPVTTADTQRTAAGAIARVVDENAPVKILEPGHPFFNTPNKITDADFQGWVQERNAYNLVTFDTKYTPLLESHDTGEQENKGGLVIAPVGKGNYIYCSYSFFRQLPAGVPGAYRLFANLLSLRAKQAVGRGN